jgi:hypothetical protein
MAPLMVGDRLLMGDGCHGFECRVSLAGGQSRTIRLVRLDETHKIIETQREKQRRYASPRDLIFKATLL